MDCKFCKKEIVQTEGKRKREFCNSTCRSHFWYNQNKKDKPKDALFDKKPIASRTLEIANNRIFINEPNPEIKAQIDAIKAEKIPPLRDTLWGRKSWKVEQENRIKELEKQLYKPI